jgi:hypothetical protein
MGHVTILFVWVFLMCVIRYVDYMTDKDKS